MLKGMQQVNEWLGQLTDLAKTLVVIGIIVGILFDDYFITSIFSRKMRNYE